MQATTTGNPIWDLVSDTQYLESLRNHEGDLPTIERCSFPFAPSSFKPSGGGRRAEVAEEEDENPSAVDNQEEDQAEEKK